MKNKRCLTAIDTQLTHTKTNLKDEEKKMGNDIQNLSEVLYIKRQKALKIVSMMPSILTFNIW